LSKLGRFDWKVKRAAFGFFEKKQAEAGQSSPAYSISFGDHRSHFMASQNNPTNHKNGDLVREAAMQEIPAVLQRLRTSPSGLSEEEAATRLEQYGPNEVGQEKKHDWLWRLWVAVRNPLVILLTILAIVTFATAQSSSDTIGGWVMVAMVVLGVSLRFIQETKADNAAAKLKAMIKVTATVVRDGQTKEIPLKELVPATW
jgi:magnesium-transporting ATPase (P-type)